MEEFVGADQQPIALEENMSNGKVERNIPDLSRRNVRRGRRWPPHSTHPAPTPDTNIRRNRKLRIIQKYTYMRSTERLQRHMADYFLNVPFCNT